MAEEPKKWVWRTPSWVPGHIEKYLTDPEAAHLWDASMACGKGLVPTLLLTTTGRKSGEPRHSPVLYGKVGDSYAVIASKGGYPTDPAWYVNLQANPEAEIRVASRRMRVRARTAQGEERTRIWNQMREMYPPFDDYQARAKSLEIPVIVLDPVG